MHADRTSRRYVVTMGCAKFTVDAPDQRDARRQARALYRDKYGNYGMEPASAVAEDWREQIADVALPVLTEPGVCIVRLGTDGKPEVVSRLYKRADYDSVRAMRRVGHSQATRAINRDCVNYYVVEQFGSGLVVWTGPSSILIQRGAED